MDGEVETVFRYRCVGNDSVRDVCVEERMNFEVLLRTMLCMRGYLGMYGST